MTPTTRRRTRRTLGVGIALAALFLSGCAGAATQQDSAEEDANSPIRVAIVSPHSGPYAEFGEQQRAGFQFAADQANAEGGIDGRKVELFVADSLGTNEGAVSAAQRLVQQEGADYIMGTVATPVTLALMQRLDSWDVLQFGTQSQGDDLTGSACVPRFFRTNMSDHIDIQGLEHWLGERNIHNWDSIAADYAFGQDSADGLKELVDKNGWSLGRDLYAPLGTSDYASYINNLKGGGGLLVSLSGGDSVNFLGQALDFGALDDYELVVGNTALTTSSLNAVSDDRLVGHWGTANWGPTADIPESQDFVKEFTEANGEPPADFTGAAYMAMQTLFAGVEKAGTVDPTEVGRALEGLTFTTIKGEVTMRAEDHQMEAPMFMGQVKKFGDRFDLAIKQAIPMSETMPEPDPACDMGEL